MIYRVLILGHVLGDFYFQSDRMARRKKREMKVLAKHCLIYCFSIFLCSFWFVPWMRKDVYICYLFAILILHALIDYGKSHLKAKGNQCFWFFIDQGTHLVLLLGPAGGFAGTGVIELWGNAIDCSRFKPAVAVLICILLCGEPASIFVKTVFQDLKDRDKDMGTLKLTAQERDTPDRAGAAIGVLEREIIFILGIMNQFSAIGFVLAAKSLARFEQLKNKGFAERYLIGTLLSALIAIGCAAVYGLTAS